MKEEEFPIAAAIKLAKFELLFMDLRKPLIIVVGVAGFEPTTSSSRTKRAATAPHPDVFRHDPGGGSNFNALGLRSVC